MGTCDKNIGPWEFVYFSEQISVLKSTTDRKHTGDSGSSSVQPQPQQCVTVQCHLYPGTTCLPSTQILETDLLPVKFCTEVTKNVHRKV